MTTFHFQTHVSESGVIALPPDARRLYGKNVIVNVDVDDKKKPRSRSKRVERTPEERQAAYEDFMASWAGCLEGMPHMTAKEIRAERMEKKYGHRYEKNEGGEE